MLYCVQTGQYELEGSHTIYVAGRGILHCASEGRQAAHSNSAGIESSQHSEATYAIR